MDEEDIAAAGTEEFSDFIKNMLNRTFLYYEQNGTSCLKKVHNRY